MAPKRRCIRTDPIDKAAKPGSRLKRFSCRPGFVDHRAVSGLERLRRRSRIEIYQERASYKCDDLLDNAIDRNFLPDLFRLRKRQRNHLDEARIEKLDRIGKDSGRLRAIPEGHW